MRKIYILAVAVMLATAVNAQRLSDQHDFNAMYSAATAEENEASLRMGQEMNATNPTRGGGESVFYEDFANGFDGNNGYGGWSVEDTGGGSIWMVADANSPAGEFSSTIAGLNSNTAANGWVIFDCDLFNTPIADGVSDVEGWITSPSIDMSTMSSVIVEWQQYFRYCCFPFAPVFLEVSNDGGTTWTTFEAKGNFIESANTLSANPLNTSVDVSCAAAGQADVRLRFAYKQAPETGNGYSHYFWGIDDVSVYENPILSDLSAVQAATNDLANLLEFTRIPLDQAVPGDQGGMIAGLIYRNAGNLDIENTIVTFEILDDNGTVLNTTTSDAFTAVSAANSPVCPANAQDTLYLATGWTPTATGTYTLRATIGAEIDEDNPDNNVIETLIVYTDDEYAKDLGGWNLELRPREGDVAGLFDPTGHGNFFIAPNEGTTAYGALIAFGPNSDVETEMQIRLYTLDGVALNEANFEETFYQVTEEYVPANAAGATLTYYPFEDPIDLQTFNNTANSDGVFYFLGVMNDFESPGELTIMANANFNTDNGSGSYEQTGAGDFVWFTSQTYTPAVRMVTSPRVAIDEMANMNGIDLRQNAPNPAVNTTNIEFYLVTPKAVTFELHDMQGRIVEVRDLGTLAGGEHRIVFDVSALNAGMYYYTMVVDGVRLTRKMMVGRN